MNDYLCLGAQCKDVILWHRQPKRCCTHSCEGEGFCVLLKVNYKIDLEGYKFSMLNVIPIVMIKKTLKEYTQKEMRWESKWVTIKIN